MNAHFYRLEKDLEKKNASILYYEKEIDIYKDM